MANCHYCGRALPGSEVLCRDCLEERYEEANAPQRSVYQQVRHSFAVVPVTSSIITLNVAVFLLMIPFAVMIPMAFFSVNPTLAQLIAWGGNYGPLTLHGQWWRVITCAFVHASFFHLWFNMLCLLYLGRLAERSFGGVTFSLAYLVTGICASLASLVFHPAVVAVGASGAIFGVAGILIPPLFLKRLSITAKKLENPLKALLVFSAFNLVLGAIVPGIDNAAHGGGLVSGLLIGFLVALYRKPVAVNMDTVMAPQDHDTSANAPTP